MFPHDSHRSLLLIPTCLVSLQLLSQPLRNSLTVSAHLIHQPLETSFLIFYSAFFFVEWPPVLLLPCLESSPCWSWHRSFPSSRCPVQYFPLVAVSRQSALLEWKRKGTESIRGTILFAVFLNQVPESYNNCRAQSWKCHAILGWDMLTTYRIKEFQLIEHFHWAFTN